MQRTATILLTGLFYLVLIQGVAPNMTRAAATDDATAIRATIGQWNDAWNQKDFDRFISYYSPAFRQDGYSFNEWRVKNEQIFYKYDDISFTIEDLWVVQEGDRASASFIQLYRNPEMPPMGLKTLEMVESNNRWEIIGETWNPVDSNTQTLEDQPSTAETVADTQPAPPPPSVPAEETPSTTLSSGTEGYRRANTQSTYPYTLQIAAYPTRAQAFGEVNQLIREGYEAFFALAHIPTHGDWFRVFVGYYATKEDVLAAAAELKKGKYSHANLVAMPYALQIGHYPKTSPQLENTQRSLRDKGYIGYTVADKNNPNEVRLLIGGYKTRQEAERRAREIKKDEITAIVDLR